jgi:DNA-binding CsgD family transcriptional regulator
MLQGFTTAWLVSALVDTGEHRAAEDALTAVSSWFSTEAPLAAIYLFDARGRLRLAQGRTEDAVADLAECGRRMEERRAFGPGVCGWREHLALALLALGERDRADALVREALRRARVWGVPWALSEALRAAGTVVGGPEGEGLLREAVAVAADAPLQRARALTGLGVALRRTGQRVAAREPLRAALDLALGRGAAALARTAHEELLAAGARPRHLRTGGAEALTPTERRVAAMAADGSTNRAVAQALFVSEKTVETHLGHVFRKLAIGSRSQLGAALAGQS